MDKNIQFHIVIQSDGSEWLVSDEFDKAILLLPLPDICM